MCHLNRRTGLCQDVYRLGAPFARSNFHPVIEIAGDVLPEQVWLPSMMIQIPVENSVKHALRGKEGKRNLWIAADRREGGVCIRITDNGGGYHRRAGTEALVQV